MRKMKGVIAAMITPMTRKGVIDPEALEEYIEFLISNKINALYPLGTTGEMLHLTMDERKVIAETVVQMAAGRLPVFIHTGSTRMDETIELSQHAYAIGADGIGVVTPIFMSLTDHEMKQFYITVASSVPDHFPIYLYNIPQCAGNDITPNVAAAIVAHCPNVQGIKYSYPNIMRTLAYLNIQQNTFSVLAGPDAVFQATLALGCDGIVSGIAGVYPELLSAAYLCFLNHDLKKAKALQFLISKVSEILQNGSNMAYFKRALQLRGIDAGYMRAPQLDLNKRESEELGRKMFDLQIEIKDVMHSCDDYGG